MNQLSSDFIIELAKSCLVSKDILEIVRPHLQYSYLSSEPEKQIFKYLFDFHSANNASPSLGLLSQNVNSRDALGIIGKIREVNVYDKKESIIETFEEYIRRAKFLDIHQKTADLFNKGEHDKALSLMTNESKLAHEFSLKRKMHSRIYGQFDKRQEERQNQEHKVSKVPTGISALDYHSRGGPDAGTGILGVGRSAAGKTTFLRSLGYHASFRGINVIHFASGDSTQKEIEDGYDAMWTGIDVHDIREGNLSGVDLNKIEKAKKAYISQAGEIYVHVFKQFHSASILDCRNILIELLKEVPIGLVLFDLLEGFDPGDGKRYSTNQDGTSARKKATSEKIINIATEFNLVVGAVTQASDIKKEFWNNPNFVITRNDISNLKATIDPFAYCVTLNQTEDENDNEVMRIHEEKLRHYKIQSWQATYPIAQNRAKGRFIDVAETNKKFWDVEKKQIIRNKPARS